MDRELLEQRKQMLTELVHDKAYVPMKAKEIAMLLNIPKAMRGELQEVLDELVSEGKLGISKKGKYGKPETFAVVGTFTGHARGFGFVTVEENSLHTVDFKPSFSISFWVEFNHLHAV